MNKHTRQIISSFTVAVTNDDFDDENDGHVTRTDLDSHANMVVVGRHCAIIEHTGKFASVSPFTPDYEALSKVPIVDAALLYDCPFTGFRYVLIVRNALHVPAMKHNLIPPFIMREAGIKVDEIPKIHTPDPTEETHSIYFENQKFRIPLSLWGIFSYFPTSKPSELDLEACDDVYMLTPNGFWDPHSDAYARNEESMLDWEGNMIEESDRNMILLKEIPEDHEMSVAAMISSAETTAIDMIYEEITGPEETIHDHQSHMSDPVALRDKLVEQACLGHFMTSIGSTNAKSSRYIFEEESDNNMLERSSTSSDENGNEELDLDNIGLHPIEGDTDEQLNEFMASAAHGRPRKQIQAEHLSKVWRIKLEEAQQTLNITSQSSTRTSNPLLSRNYGTGDRMLRYKRLKEHFFMDTFFATSKAGRSTRGNTCCQLFVTDKGFVYVVPMKTRAEVMKAVKQFAKEIGAPEALICDAAREQRQVDLRSFCNEIGTTLRVLEENTPWANKAELYIGLVKESVRKDMKEANCPLSLWDYCVERRARINNLTARGLFQLHGSNAHTALTGEEGDISNLCQYQWYEWCYYRENTNKFPFNREVLGRILGPARGEGNEMAQWILKANGNVVPRRSHRPLNTAEIHSEIEIRKRKIFDVLIEGRHGSAISPPIQPGSGQDDEYEDFEAYQDEDEEPRIIPEQEDSVDATGKLINQQPAYDSIINAEVQLQLGNEMSLGKVKRRAIGPDGTTVGTYCDNPIMNSIVYEVEFPDGQVKEYAANIIAENMLTQVDSDGYSTTLMDGIVDYKKDEPVAVAKSDKWVVTNRGTRRLRKTTKGWKLLVRWKDDSETWIPLKDMKESHPVETAEFAKARGIDDEAAFAYWVPYTLRKRDVIIHAVKARARKVTHKYGIEVPNNMARAMQLDEGCENKFWTKSILKEMQNVGIAFQILENQESVPVGWQKVTGHLVFDVKMDFTRKARWVLDGHRTPDPVGSTFAGVVSRESVRIALTYAALNDLDVTAADIRNAYLQAPSSQKDYIVCGPEFGIEHVGKRALIRRALYGGKTAGRDFRNHLRECMMHLGFSSCLADPDVWMRPALKSDGTEVYEYILLYVDDVLAISENGEKLLREGIGKYFELKEESIGPPTLYLGGRLRKVELDNGVKAWGFGSSQYVQEAVRNVKLYLEKTGGSLPTRSQTPLQANYRPELDVTTELDPTMAAYYQSLVGILRWIVELGRVDVCLEVSLMSSHLALPREGHLVQLFHIFAYLDKYHNTEMVFDPSDPVIDEAQFERMDWTSSEFSHVERREEIPANMPEARGLGFTISAKVDADHASDTTTRRSRTGFFVFINSALVYWMSKKQTSVETSSFGSEFCAMKLCCEYLRGLRYKLRMMGIPCEGPCYVFGDNKSVLYNATIPDSALKKKSQSIAYHFIREGSARDEWRMAYINTHDNEADLLTKTLPSGEKRKGFVRNLLHHIFRSEERNEESG